MILIIVTALFLVCLPPETVSQQCRSGVTDEVRQSVREQLRQGQNGTISTVAVNCGQVCLIAMCGCMDLLQYKVCMLNNISNVHNPTNTIIIMFGCNVWLHRCGS